MTQEDFITEQKKKYGLSWNMLKSDSVSFRSRKNWDSENQKFQAKLQIAEERMKNHIRALEAARVAEENGVHIETFETEQQAFGSGSEFNSDIRRAYREAEDEKEEKELAMKDIQKDENFAEFYKEWELKLKAKNEETMKGAEVEARNAWNHAWNTIQQ